MHEPKSKFSRRGYLKAGAGFLGFCFLGSRSANAAAPRFRFAHTLAPEGGLKEALKLSSQVGFVGYEPSRTMIMEYLDRPLAVKTMFTDAGITMVSCSNEGPHFSTDWLDPQKIPQTIKDHVEFARDFIRPIGMSDHFKIIPTRIRPNGGPTDDVLERMADAQNETGRQMAQFGIRFAPHNLVGTAFYLESELRRVMELTDPRYVWMTVDTAHLSLGGMDPAMIIDSFFTRIAAVHYKDISLIFHRTGQVLLENSGVSYFRSMGGADAGGVDFRAIQRVLTNRNYTGWVCIDVDGGMPNEGSSALATLRRSRDFLVNDLDVGPSAV